MASNAENVSIWWRHHGLRLSNFIGFVLSQCCRCAFENPVWLGQIFLKGISDGSTADSAILNVALSLVHVRKGLLLLISRQSVKSFVEVMACFSWLHLSRMVRVWATTNDWKRYHVCNCPRFISINTNPIRHQGYIKLFTPTESVGCCRGGWNLK